MYSFIIRESQNGRILRNILQNEMKISSRFTRRIVEQRSLTVNGKVVFLTSRVKTGDVVNIVLPKEQSSVLSEPMDLDIRYEDAEVVVVNKPPGRLTHPSARERWGSILAGVQAYLDKDGLVPHSVHRLDRDTSGLVMFAKHAHAHHLFDIALQEGNMHRSYIALVHDLREINSQAASLIKPSVDAGWQTIDLPIAQSEEMLSRRVISTEGQSAVTHFRVIGKTQGVCAVELQLETGRTHQIRLHMSSVGLPLVGERDYPARFLYEDNQTLHRQIDELNLVMKRQALHAFRLAWKHPVTKCNHEVTAPVPTDMQTVWNRLDGDPLIWEPLLT